MKNWFVYLLRCKDESLYTGITNNLEKRYEKHKKGEGAKYTKIKGVKRIEVIFLVKNKSQALKVEYFIKKKTKKYKEELIVSLAKKNFFIEEIKVYFGIEIDEYSLKWNTVTKNKKNYKKKK